MSQLQNNSLQEIFPINPIVAANLGSNLEIPQEIVFSQFANFTCSNNDTEDKELGNHLEGQGYHLWVVTLALEPVTRRNHLLEGQADGPRPLKFEFMAPKI